MIKEKYLLFGYDWYYPEGGMNDYYGGYDSLEDVFDFINSKGCSKTFDWQIYDTETKAVILRINSYGIFTSDKDLKFTESQLSKMKKKVTWESN